MCCALLKLEVIYQWLTVGCLPRGVSQRQKGTGGVLQLVLYLLGKGAERNFALLPFCLCCDKNLL